MYALLAVASGTPVEHGDLLFGADGDDVLPCYVGDDRLEPEAEPAEGSTRSRAVALWCVTLGLAALAGAHVAPRRPSS